MTLQLKGIMATFLRASNSCFLGPKQNKNPFSQNALGACFDNYGIFLMEICCTGSNSIYPVNTSH